MTAMIRPPERWQVADALAGGEAFLGDVWQRTNESAAAWTNEQSDGRGESGSRFPAAAHGRTSLVAHNANRGGEHRSAGAVRHAVEPFVAVLVSRFKIADQEQSGLTRARWRRSQRSDVIGEVKRSTSGFGAGWLAVRAATGSMAGERPVLRAACALVAIELRTSRRGVDEFEH
jgi:hypothetical protein